jgi:hypothetical protein
MAKRHHSSKSKRRTHKKSKSHSRSNKKTKSHSRSHRKMMHKGGSKVQRGGVYYGFNLEDRISNQPAVFAGSNCPASRPDSKEYIYEMYGLNPSK